MFRRIKRFYRLNEEPILKIALIVLIVVAVAFVIFSHYSLNHVFSWKIFFLVKVLLYMLCAYLLYLIFKRCNNNNDNNNPTIITG